MRFKKLVTLNKFLAAVFYLTCCAVHSASAQAGDLDLSFDGKGYSVEAFTGSGYAWASTTQQDGKIVVVGTGSYGQTQSRGFTAVRYNIDGSLDTTFGNEGRVLTSFGGTSYYAPGVTGSQAFSVAVQPDGKIVLAGSVQYRLSDCCGSDSDIALVRYNPDGSLDTSFDGDGRVRTFVNRSAHASGRAVAITPDGKIVVAGGDSFGMMINRYNTDGSLDNTFDGDGKLLYTAGRFASAMVLQPDGKIVVTGQRPNTTGGSGVDFETIRFNADGTIDTSFNGTGVAPIPAVYGEHYAHSLLLQPDGKIIVEGYWNGYMALMRYNPNGTFDNSFGTDGFAYFAGSINWYGGKIAELQPDGRIIIAGQISSGAPGIPNFDLRIVRLNSNGTFDTSFGGTGSVSTPVTKANDIPTGVMVQPDGKIIVTGFPEIPAPQFAAVRLKSDGSLDTAFGSGGKVLTEVGYGGQSANDIAFQSDEKIVAVGGYEAFTIARYRPDGTMDKSFNGTGAVKALQGSGSTANAVAVQADGKIVAAGHTRGVANDEAALVRFNSDGSVDNTFGIQGQVITPLGPNHDDLAAMAIQPDGKIVVAGRAWLVDGKNGSDFALARYNTDGSLDSTFDEDGKVIGNPCAERSVSITSIEIQDDGKIVAAGSCDGLTVFRFNTDGSVDTSFNKTGRVTKAGANGYGSKVKLQDDGKIVVSGISSFLAFQDFLVIRYNPDGTLDNSFNGSGIATQSVGSGEESGASLAIQKDGKIVAGGSARKGYLYSFAIVRFNADGTTDHSWGDNGVAALGVEGDGFLYAAKLDSIGRVVVAGYWHGLFGVGRFYGDNASAYYSSVAGRITNGNGSPVNRATITITDPNGTARAIQTNSFGYYRFDNVQTGAIYTFSVSAKGYRFSPRTLTVGGELTDLDFTPNGPGK